MSFGLPRSKSAATVTARGIRAAAADLRRAAEGLDHAAELYAKGKPDKGENEEMKIAFGYAQGGWSLARNALSFLKTHGVSA